MLVRLTKKPGKALQKGVEPVSKFVWINPHGVNSLEAAADDGTWVRMDDGTGYLVSDSVWKVASQVNRVLDGEGLE